ncbi:DUF1800 domain-containing protein [Croceiramulus getboli]|nr:DUF1800 domain-containing protein [Flavobacteriaceae bacterium YJPT1-3]
MTMMTSCNIAGTSAYTPTTENPWNAAKVRHVYRRLGYGATPATVNLALAGTPQELIDQLLSEAISMPNTEAPAWANWTIDNFTNFDEENEDYIRDWKFQAARDIFSKGLKARMAFFWSNHFVTQLDTYFYAPYLYQYWDVLQTYALGNFREFVRVIGINNAMLIFLNGFENTEAEPNENYARELFELFTLGADNGYTQEDIEEASRALTGYNHWESFGSPITFEASTFDATDKTIFGQTGPWGYDDLINILFEQRGDLIAPYICTKLYTYFVSPDVNEDIIAIMAQTFIDNDFEIAPVLDQLFKSEHFFDPDAEGGIIKSPYDLVSTYLTESGFQYNDAEDEVTGLIVYITDTLGQDLFQPIDVAGWQRNQDWINSSTLTGRWLGMEYVSWNMWDFSKDQFRQFAKDLTGDSNDPAFITRTIVDYFISKPLYTESDYEVATSIFRWEVPENYFDDGTWDLDWSSADYQTLLLIFHIFKMPEFQLK